MQKNSSAQKDALYLADGPWGLDYLDEYATVNLFDITSLDIIISCGQDLLNKAQQVFVTLACGHGVGSICATVSIYNVDIHLPLSQNHKIIRYNSFRQTTRHSFVARAMSRRTRWRRSTKIRRRRQERFSEAFSARRNLIPGAIIWTSFRYFGTLLGNQLVIIVQPF